MTLNELRIYVDLQFSDWRSIKYLVNTQKFVELWEHIKNEDKDLIFNHIKTGSKEALFHLVKVLYKKTLDELSTTELKQLARQLKISNYSRFTKKELIRLIRELKDDSLLIKEELKEKN